MVSGVLCVVLISGFQGDPIAGPPAKGSFHILRAAKSQRKAIMWLVAHTLRPAGLNFGLSHGWDVPSAWKESSQELLNLLPNGAAQLYCFGTGQPPHSRHLWVP